MVSQRLAGRGYACGDSLDSDVAVESGVAAAWLEVRRVLARRAGL
jgi:hypothetical protein